jgi:alpha-tubulin suppressor-like RCC1 family protein
MWGNNDNGQLGIGSTENKAKPVKVLFDEHPTIKP